MFKINKYLSLELQKNKTLIFLGGSKFLVCKAVFVDIDRYFKTQAFNTVDELIDDEKKRVYVSISPEEEFWVHCSNLQAWVENNYDTSLLHSNIAFPLLERLVGLGDHLARKVFVDEVIKKIKSDHIPTVIYLLKRGYLDMFTDEEFDILLSEVSKKIYSIDKKILDMVFNTSDFDEIPSIDRLSARAVIFLVEHPKINFIELLTKYEQCYVENYKFWILDSLEKLIKNRPESFKSKIEMLLEKGLLVFPRERKDLIDINGLKFNETRLDYSEMNDFTIALYFKYKSLVNH